MGQCLDCQQCKRIEERDGGPARQEIIDGKIPCIDSIAIISPYGIREIAAAQQNGDNPISRIQLLVKEQSVASQEELNAAGREFETLHGQHSSMRISDEEVLQIRIVPLSEFCGAPFCEARHFFAGRPWQRLGVDLVRPLPEID